MLQLPLRMYDRTLINIRRHIGPSMIKDHTPIEIV